MSKIQAYKLIFRNRNESQIKLNFHFYLNKIIIIKINAGI